MAPIRIVDNTPNQANFHAYSSNACSTGIQWFKEKGRLKPRDHTPNAGDIIFFDLEQDGISEHVGIVVKMENGMVHTVESNSNDECRLIEYILNGIFVYGYGVIK
ncbi:MAG: CHAP domain-containing protein [Erysipelotrichaceae bacterium]